MNLDDAMSKAQEHLDATTETTEAPAVVETTTTEAAPVVEATATPAPAVETPPAEGRARGPDGKFAKAAPTVTTATVPPPAAAAPTITAPPVVEAPKYKPPQSWKPLAREKWAALPPEVQEEIDRRESEVPRVLQEAAQARKFQEQVTEALRPYEMIARAAGQHPVQYAAGLMQTAAALQTGAPRQRAAVVANIIKSFGVSVEDLAAELDGQPAPQGQPQQPPVNVEALIDQRLQTMRQQAEQHRVQGQVAKFKESHPYLEDPELADLAAAIIETSAKRGVEMDLEDAYSRAVMAHPKYRAEVERQKATVAATEANASAQRAVGAAVSVRSQSAAPMRAQPKGIDAAMNAAADKLGL